MDELAKINKHRRVPVAVLSGFSMSGLMADLEEVIDWGNPAGQGVIHNTTSGNILTAEQAQMQGDLIAFVAFNEGAIKGVEVGLATETFVGLATNAIKWFGKFFV